MSLQEVRKALGVVSVLGVVILMNLDKFPESYISSLFYTNADNLSESYINALFHIMLQFMFMYGFLTYVSRHKILHTAITLFIIASLAVKLSYDSYLSIGVLMSIVGTSSSEILYFIESYTIATCLVGLLLFGIIASSPPSDIKTSVAFIVVGTFYITSPLLNSQGAYASYDYERWIRSGLARGLTESQVLNSQGAYASYDYERWIRSGLARGLTESQAHVEYILVTDIGDRFPLMKSIKGVSDTVNFISKQSDTSSSWTGVSVQNDSPDILIIGLGESLRADHLSLYGYERETTPLLSKMDDLRIYNNVYSGGTNTWASVPAMLTKVSERPDLSKSIVSLAKDAGHKTFWLSNQTKLRQSDFSVSAIATQSDHVYFSASDDSSDIKHDSILLPKLSKILAEREPDQKILIVLNFYGSHGGFKQRYPKNYEIFKGVNERLNQYDNTVLYTDYVLAQALELSSEYGAKFIYFSDHGLRNYHGDMPLYHDVRENPDIDSIQVPLISNSDLDLDASHITNLFYFECIFSDWSGISANELGEDYCKESLSDKRITFYDSQLDLRRVSVQL